MKENVNSKTFYQATGSGAKCLILYLHGEKAIYFRLIKKCISNEMPFTVTILWLDFKAKVRSKSNVIHLKVNPKPQITGKL